MKVVFVIAIFDSFGEREHALSFARQLGAAGCDTHFVVTRPSQVHLQARGVVPRLFATAAEARAILDELAPDWLVACEWFNLPRDLQDTIAHARCRLATMDGTGMGPAINSNPFDAPDAPVPPPLPAGMIRLRPCPVNAPLAPGDGCFSWSLFPGIVRSDGSACRRRLGIARETKVGLLALAPWALAAAERLGRGGHYRDLFRTIANALQAAPDAVELILISPHQAPPITRGRLTMRFSPYLPADAYEELLLGCDLVVSDNIIQTSLSKAFAARIPTLVVVDSRPEAPPWNIFPLRRRFPVDAPYARAVAPVEIADADGLGARVRSALAGALVDDYGYRAALARLPSPIAILGSASG